MTLPAAGAISLNDVNVELGFSATAARTLNDTIVRRLARLGESPAAVELNSLHGKTGITITSGGPYNDGSSIHNGFFLGDVTYGSVYPATSPINGNNLLEFYFKYKYSPAPDVYSFAITLNGTLSQNAFTSLIIGTDGVEYEATTASATFSTAGGKSTWSWLGSLAITSPYVLTWT